MNSHIPQYIKDANAMSTPEEGTRTPAGKMDPENQRKLPVSEAVRNATEVTNAAKLALDKQLGRGTPSGGKLGNATNQPSAGAPASDECDHM